MSSKEIQIILAPKDYEADVLSEIEHRKSISVLKHEEALFWVDGAVESLWWAQWQLNNVKKERFESISQATKILKSYGKNWLNLDFKWHRRSTLIQDGLPKVKIQEFLRGGPVTKWPACGAWFLEEPGLLNFSLDLSLPYRNGIIKIPDDTLAPSRAYRKLDEVFTRLERWPSKKEKVLDLGSYPGGWTWVLSQLAGQVVSVDTVPFDGPISRVSNIEFIKKDAFKLDPKDIGPIDWFFSDIICEPARLFVLIETWRKSGYVKNFICTIKFKGHVDFSLLARFQQIPNSQIVHLNANKHELTWICLDF